MAKKVINSFNAGELSPYLYARSDLDKYHSGCLTMENFVPLPYGGATRRPAIEYKFASVDDDKVRLVTFAFSTEETYLLAIGDGEINIYQDGTLKDTVTAVWADTELDDLKWVQSADVMWFTHPSYAVQRLERASATSWSIADVEWDYQPSLDENEEDIFLDLTFSGTAWAPSTAYSQGDRVISDGITYKCLFDQSGSLYTNLEAFQTAYADGHWQATNEGLTATLEAWDAASGGSAYALFPDNSVIGDRYFLGNTRNGKILESGGTKGPFNPATLDGFYLSQKFSERTAGIISTPALGATTTHVGQPLNASFSNWSFDFTATAFSGTVTIERSLDLGDTWEDYVIIGDVATAQGKAFSAASESEEPSGSWIRWKVVSFVATTVSINLTLDDARMDGIVEITGWTDTNTVTVEVISDVQKELGTSVTGVAASGGVPNTLSKRTKMWSEGAFSSANGFPSSVAMFENRLCFAGTLTNPNRIWLSQIDDYQNFQVTNLATGAMDLILNSGRQDEIKWLVPQEILVIGTSGGEWALGPVADNQPVTPTDYNLKQKSTYGTSGVQGLLVNNAVLFPMRQNRKIREWFMQYDTKEAAQDVTILSEHITNGGITQWDYQQQPDNILWSIRGDGTLLGFTYERDQNVTGWHRHVVNDTTKNYGIFDGSDDYVDLETAFTHANTSAGEIDFRCSFKTSTAPSSDFIYNQAGDFEVELTDENTIRVIVGRDAQPGGSFVINQSGNFTSDFDDGEWHNLRVELDPTVTTGNLSITIDGVHATGSPFDADCSTCVYDNSTYNAVLGAARAYGVGTVPYAPVKADISHASLSLGGVKQFTFSFDDATGTVVSDITGANDGVVIGSTTFWGSEDYSFSFESVAVIPSINEEDQVWVSIKAEIDGLTKRYIGRFDDREWGTDYTTEWRGSDLYTVFSSPGSATLTGLGYLEGKTVSVVADGVPKANAVVTSGEITVDSAAYTTIVVGPPFTATLAPIYLNSESQYGTSRGSQVGCSKAIIRFKDTYSASVGQSVSDVESVRFDGDDTALYNDDAEAYFDNGSDFLLTCYIVNSDQMPCTVLAMIPKLEVAR